MTITTLAVIALSLCGCSSAPTLPPRDDGLKREATIFLATPETGVQPQFLSADERARVTSLELGDARLQLLGTVSAHLLGYATALAQLSTGSTMVTTATYAAATAPVAAFLLAFDAGAELVDMSREKQAEARIAPLRAALEDFDFDAPAARDLREMAPSSEVFDITDVVVLDDPENTRAEQRAFTDRIEARPTDSALVILLIPQFSPRFEVFELEAIYAVFDRDDQGRDTGVYGNAVVYQSEHHAGAFPDGTVNQVRELLLARQHELEARKRRAHGGNLPEFARNDIALALRDYREDLLDGYKATDDFDPTGRLWLAGDAAPTRAEYHKASQEIARLVFADLAGACHEDVPLEILPGSSFEMSPCAALDRGDRRVFRDEDGILHSIDAKSRWLPREGH